MEPLATPVIRRIRPDDGQRMRALRLEALADTPIAFGELLADAETHPPEYWSSRAAARAEGSTACMFVAEVAEVAEVDGAFVGSANGVAEDDRTAVRGVYVTPAYRGSGLIELLFAEVAAWSVANGRAELELDVARQNPRALAAYERLGFVLTGKNYQHPLFPDAVEQEMVRPANWSAPATGTPR